MLLAQKNFEPNLEEIHEAIRLFSGVADLDFEPSYIDHVYFQYLSNSKDNIALLDAYHPEEIFDKYIIRVADKGFTVVDHPSEVYGLPDSHECINGNLPLRLVLDIDARQKPDPTNPELPSLDRYKISRNDLLSRILIACADILYSDLKHLITLNAFALASSSNDDKCSWHIVCSDAHFIDYRDLRGFVEKVADRVGKPYSEFIDLTLYKSRFSLRLLGSAKGDRIKRPAISSIKKGYRNLEDYLVQPKFYCSEIWPRTFSSEKLEKEEIFQHIEDETALSKGANLVIAKYEWLEVGNIRKGFVNFQAQSLKACPICNISHEKDQLYGFLRSNGYFILKCYRQKQYKPDHKGLVFGEASGIIKPKERPKWGLNDRLINVVKNPRLLPELSGKNINVKEMEEAPEAYPDFLSSICSTTLIRSPVGTGKTKALREILKSLAENREDLPCFSWISYRKTLSNETKAKVEILQSLGLRVCQYQEVEGSLAISDWDVIIVQVESTHHIELHRRRPYVVILDEVNAIMRQMSSGIHARESENALRDLLKSAIHVVAMDAFANDSTIAFLKQYRDNDIRIFDNKYQPRIGETVKILYDPDKGSEAMRRGLKMLREGKRVAFAITSCKKARALANQASALQKPDGSPILTRVYFGQMDGMQRQEDFTNINATWSSLDCVIYTSTVEAGISFEIPNHFDAIIGISNIKTGVHVEAFTQMLYRIRDCPQRIISLYNSKNSFEIFQEPNRNLIRAGLSALRPIDLPTAVKGHREWDKIADCYALDASSAVETYIEAEYQRRLSAKYFPEILCSLVSSTGASLEIISAEGTIANRKIVSNIIKAIEENIKCSDAELIANAPDIIPDDAEILKQISTRSFNDNMILQRHYLWRIYASGDIGGKDDHRDWSMDDAKWINLCNTNFVKKFNNSEPLRHFRRLAYFRRQGSDAIKALEGLKTKEVIQWKESHNSLDPSSNDLRKAYLSKQWETIQKLFQILGFTGIDDERILSGSMVSEAFMQSCERFIEIRNQSLLLFGFKSRAKETPDLKSAIKAINAIAGNWCGYTIKSDKKRIGPKGQQVWQYSYKINRQSYNGTGFGDKGAPELPPYKLKTDNEIQELFDSIRQEN